MSRVFMDLDIAPPPLPLERMRIPKDVRWAGLSIASAQSTRQYLARPQSALSMRRVQHTS
jgi:hypothetical protein